jgi:outer membrane protein OmpA-like peptidoglycan-associated protein
MRRSGRLGPVPAIAAAGFALAIALVSGCAGGSAGPEEREDGRGASPAQRYAGGPLIKEAKGMLKSSHARIEVKRVERFADRSVLRFYLTHLGTGVGSFSFATSAAGMAFHEIRFDLVDPVGRRLYHPLRDEGGGGEMVGSSTQAFTARPGVRYEAVIHYPKLPDDVQAVTLVTPSTAGEFTGVPVVAGKGSTGPAAPVATPGAQATPGGTLALPVHAQKGYAPGRVEDLHGIAVGEVKSTTTARTEQRIGLRADVLFDFDKATLTAKARAVLDDVAAQTRAEADPAKPPIIITGHTDGTGNPAYNLRLSQQRADAVLNELRTRLGTAYQYKAEGKGETRPVVKEGGGDDEQARARNRRVEISYKIKQEGTRSTTSTTQGPVSPATASGPPAAFRPTDGPTVASRTVDYTVWGKTTKRRMDVKPFYRDGAFLVAVFDITNLGPGTLGLTEDYSAGGVGTFGAFSVADPASKIIYQGVMVGPPDKSDGVNIDRLDTGWGVFEDEPKTTNRGFFYVPAPPPGTKAVNFHAGAFGVFTEIPIR